ncbi:hypothetical protein RFI_12603 [Reticulomyxa filosa]|uniref:Uncharacterized protein n=1 Tax=Reticulomyxa filosa TaxID=46433 RepID=X6NF72_RETFI|nr:hypothetical protein RFI_12603 [Reticulomyxa filosa]|eukprot:ETO24558.1 hypothetical protein RFI_12603 [Reticulomyxa filosa]
MFFGIKSIWICPIIGILLYCATFFHPSKDFFLKISLLLAVYVICPILPGLHEAQKKVPVLYDTIWFGLSSYVYGQIPSSAIRMYRDVTETAGALYIVVEAIQLLAIAIYLGEKIVEWMKCVHTKESDESEGCLCIVKKKKKKKEFGLTFVYLFLFFKKTTTLLHLVMLCICLLYALTFGMMYWAMGHENLTKWPIAQMAVIAWFVVAVVVVTACSYVSRSGVITQSALVCFFLAYILCSSVEMKITGNVWNDYSLQVAVVFFVLASIPPTLVWITSSNGNDRILNIVLFIVILLFTFAINLWLDKKVLWINLFWYRVSESVIITLLYLFFLRKE